MPKDEPDWDGSIMLGGCFGSPHTIGNIEAASQDISHGHKWIFQIDQDPNHATKLVTMWLNENKVRVLEWPSQSYDLRLENLWAELTVLLLKHILSTWRTGL